MLILIDENFNKFWPIFCHLSSLLCSGVEQAVPGVF